MKILVVGSGGREHAIAKKFMESKLVDQVFCAPGNSGMILDGIDIVAIDENDFEKLAAFAKEQEVTFTFVGPEIPLFDGIVDYFNSHNLRVFGPGGAAAQIEGSKDFAKKLMAKYGIPTAKSETFDNLTEAKAYVLTNGAPIVIKADGPAAGKGVTVAATVEMALTALDEIFIEGRYVKDKPLVVIEEFLAGPEFSVFTFIHNGQMHHSLPAKDHKRAYDEDLGPNTGGMGAYTPVPFVTDAILSEVIETVIEPTIHAMEQEGTPYNGVLYSGLILTEEGPKVIEFNARLGDPETQVLLQLLESDFAEFILDLLENKETELKWQSNTVCLGVVLAAEGYPDQPKKGIPLKLGAAKVPVSVLYAGVSDGDDFISTGGRVLMVTSKASTMEQARSNVYTYLDSNPTDGFFYRTDIGAVSLEQE